MQTHVLGNGPSINLYKPSKGFVIGCNFQQFPVDVSVVLDVRPFHVYLSNRNVFQNKPIITSVYAMNGMKHKNLEQELDIVYKLPFLDKFVSAGHVATQWALDNQHTEIHLWGFDSIWADTQETKTDEYVFRDRQQHDLYIHWREKWKAFTQYNITVHNTIEGTPLKDLICQ
jgi:hypothetical protein